MNRDAYRSLLKQRGVYDEAKSNDAVNTLMEMQYYVTKEILDATLNAGAPLTAELVERIVEQKFKRKTAAAINTSTSGAFAFGPIESLHCPLLTKRLKYDSIEVPKAPLRSNIQALSSETSEEPSYYARKSNKQVEFRTIESAPANSGPGTQPVEALDDFFEEEDDE